MSKSRKELEREGWTRRTVIDEPRLSEIAELYEELNFEVLILPVSDEDLDGCSECFGPDPSRYKTIFTRPRG
jgi:hypothetical protein